MIHNSWFCRLFLELWFIVWVMFVCRVPFAPAYGTPFVTLPRFHHPCCLLGDLETSWKSPQLHRIWISCRYSSNDWQWQFFSLPTWNLINVAQPPVKCISSTGSHINWLLPKIFKWFQTSPSILVIFSRIRVGYESKRSHPPSPFLQKSQHRVWVIDTKIIYKWPTVLLMTWYRFLFFFFFLIYSLWINHWLVSPFHLLDTLQLPSIIRVCRGLKIIFFPPCETVFLVT